MTSRKEEERNEKIIRGLLKLPPNRRCINCNSLGPQYVCTNFWTFVCITCSGIHREFTHRVKSVSMAKFTSQEVEALQKGGNQRAKEIYLKDWDAQRQRLPDSSNVDRVREFIKNVYVDRRYAGGKTSDKPPRDVQSLRNCEDETRRASSYHSYSQSPPYDYQYEDRRFGKQAAVLTRKPGSDRGHYEGKISSFVYSPGRLSDQMYEDRFANEGSVSRVSDYSVSSRGDPFRSGTQSPNFQKDVGFSSPPIQPSRDILIEDLQHQTLNTCSETNIKRGSDWISRPQRTASSGSFGSFDSTLISLKSVNSGSLKDFVSEPEQSAGTHQDKMSTFPSLLQSSFSGNTGKLDLFEPLVSPPVTSSASSIDLFQFPLTSSASPVDLFQPSLISSVSSVNMCQLPQTTIPPPLDFFSEIAQELPAATLDNKSPELSVPKNEGWATFDIPQPMTSTPGVENLNPVKITSSEGDSLGKFGPTLSSNKSMQWPSFQNFSAHGPSSSISNAWHEGLQNVQASTNPTSTQSWNAFEDSIGPLPWESIQKSSEPQVAAYKPPSIANQHLGLKVLEDSDKDVFQRTTSDSGHSLSSLPSHVVNGPSNTQLALPLMDTQSHATDHKSINPFDLPYDSDMELRNMFLDMSPLQGALPNAPLSSSFLGGVTQPWFPQNPVTPYIPAAPQAYMVGQATASQLQNVPTQGSVASIGGNPFA